MRAIRSVVVSVAMVLLSVASVAVVLPYGATTFAPRADCAAHRAFAAFVTLSPAEESAAMKAAKSSWNVDVGAVRHMRAELFVRELPKGRDEPALGLADRMSRREPATMSPGLSPFLPSLAAPPPERIAPDAQGAKDDAEPTFARDELLKMD